MDWIRPPKNCVRRRTPRPQTRPIPVDIRQVPPGRPYQLVSVPQLVCLCDTGTLFNLYFRPPPARTYACRHDASYSFKFSQRSLSVLPAVLACRQLLSNEKPELQVSPRNRTCRVPFWKSSKIPAGCPLPLWCFEWTPYCVSIWTVQDHMRAGCRESGSTAVPMPLAATAMLPQPFPTSALAICRWSSRQSIRSWRLEAILTFCHH